MTTQDHIRELATKGVASLTRDIYLETPTDGSAISPELFHKMMTNTSKLRAYLELSQYGDLGNIPSSDYIECGGLQWAPQNAGTDNENPNGKLYTFDEALTIENDLWRLPMQKEFEMFLARTCYGFDKERGVGIFIDRETFARLELPAVGYRNSSGALGGAGTSGSYWSSTQFSSARAYRMGFNSSSVNASYDVYKTYGFSVRCVRR